MVQGTRPVSRRGHHFEALSYAVFGACIHVQRQLGVHCMEVDYQRALEIALKQRGLEYEREVEIPVAYEGQVVTTRRVDFVIWDEKDQLLLETKARSELLPEDTEQCLLYLYQGRYRVCLLANFGEKPLGPWSMAPWRGAPRPHWGKGASSTRRPLRARLEWRASFVSFTSLRDLRAPNPWRRRECGGSGARRILEHEALWSTKHAKWREGREEDRHWARSST